MLLPSKLGAERAVAAAKHEAKKLINFGLFVDLYVSPEKTMHRSVFQEWYKLMVHLTDVHDEGHPFFSKLHKDIEDVTLKLQSGQGFCI